MPSNHPSFSSSSQRGAVTLYIALLMVFMLTSGALLFNTLLVKQIKITEQITSSERAFYAAASGLEEGLYKLRLVSEQTNLPVNSEQKVDDFTGSVSYEGSEAGYSVEGVKLLVGEAFSQPCVASRATYRTETRRLFTGSDACNSNN